MPQRKLDNHEVPLSLAAARVAQCERFEEWCRETDLAQFGNTLFQARSIHEMVTKALLEIDVLPSMYHAAELTKGHKVFYEDLALTRTLQAARHKVIERSLPNVEPNR